MGWNHHLETEHLHFILDFLDVFMLICCSKKPPKSSVGEVAKSVKCWCFRLGVWFFFLCPIFGKSSIWLIFFKLVAQPWFISNSYRSFSNGTYPGKNQFGGPPETMKRVSSTVWSNFTGPRVFCWTAARHWEGEFCAYKTYLQESYNTPLEHTPGNPPTQQWKDSLYNLLVKV